MANKSFILQTRKSQLSLNWRVQMRKRSDAQGFAQKGVVKLIKDITTDLLTVEMSDDVPEMLIIDRYADDRLVVTNVQPYNGKKVSFLNKIIVFSTLLKREISCVTSVSIS